MRILIMQFWFSLPCFIYQTKLQINEQEQSKKAGKHFKKKIGLNPFEITIENEELTSMCTSM